MDNSRFKFRVWDKGLNCYYAQMLDVVILQQNGWLVYDDEDYILEQCTGLKDISDRLIFEGDKVSILWDDEEEIGVVEYHNGSFLMIADNMHEFLADWPMSITIIGNIHEGV